MSEATPAATPMIEIAVMTPMTAWRRLALRYRAATNSSNRIDCAPGRAQTRQKLIVAKGGSSGVPAITMEFAEIKLGWPWLISSASATVDFVLGSLAA